MNNMLPCITLQIFYRKLALTPVYKVIRAFNLLDNVLTNRLGILKLKGHKDKGAHSNKNKKLLNKFFFKFNRVERSKTH